MSVRGYASIVPEFPENDLMTMADVEAMAERLGLVIVTDGNRFEYARPGTPPQPGWRRFAMVQKARPLKATDPR